MTMNRILLLALFCVLSVNAAFAGDQRRLSTAEITEIKQAICDEIYDYGYYGEFYQIGENIGTPKHWVARVRVYIDPAYSSADEHGQVIYKLMPFGQIYRLFFIDKDGKLTLDGNPQNKFPITQPSRQTVYMDEEDVRQDEQAWVKSSFTIDTEPSSDTIQSAVQRQKIRAGFSEWEYKHADQVGSKK
jgi:hypothetical protein